MPLHVVLEGVFGLGIALILMAVFADWAEVRTFEAHAGDELD